MRIVTYVIEAFTWLLVGALVSVAGQALLADSNVLPIADPPEHVYHYTFHQTVYTRESSGPVQVSPLQVLVVMMDPAGDPEQRCNDIGGMFYAYYSDDRIECWGVNY